MSASLCHGILSTMCPMHIVLDRSGLIVSAGPTAHKLFADTLIGRSLLEIFEVRRPSEIATMDALAEAAGKRLNLRLRRPPHRQLKGVLMEGPEVGQLVLNLSFGISVVDAVQEYNLTADDFAATDLTVEMLYLVEAKSAAMEASRQLNQRLQSARVAAEEQALTDTLTGLKNRRGMDRTLAELLTAREPFAVMHVDLDFFKSVNDTYGHAAGDFVLQEAGRIMVRESRRDDVVARVGGDEFVILLRAPAGRGDLAAIAERIIERLNEPLSQETGQYRVSGSIGIAHSADYHKPTADQLIGDADAATYAAKNAGRGCFAFFMPHMRQSVRAGGIAMRGDTPPAAGTHLQP